jgi:hypothetical protein
MHVRSGSLAEVGGDERQGLLYPGQPASRPLPSYQRHDRAFDDVAVSAAVQQSVRQPKNANGDAGRANSSHVKPRFNRGTRGDVTSGRLHVPYGGGFPEEPAGGWTSYLRNIPPIAPPIAPMGPPIPRGWWARRSVRTRLGRLVSGGEVGSAEATASRGVALSPAWAALALAKAPKTATVRIKARMACFS